MVGRCEQHGIAIAWRPPGRPHFGGVIERLVGTMMELVHGLPGTTFSNVAARGAYDSDKAACLTLEELERWFTVAIVRYYHRRPHEGIDGDSPLHRFQTGVEALYAAGGFLPVPRYPRSFFIDFLPIVRRMLGRDGITVDHIVYYSNALKPWIQSRDQPSPFLIRRDPRDLSRIFVLDPVDDTYLEIPTRTLFRPAISLWEHRMACRRIREKHREHISEANLFAVIEEMRTIEEDAVRLTCTARRYRTRRNTPRAASPDAETEIATTAPSDVETDVLRPFDDIEAW